MSFDAVGRISKLLDQVCDGLCSLGILQVMRAFPELFISLFTYTGCVCCDDVQDAIFIEDSSFVDDVIVSHLNRFISEASEQGTVLYIMCIEFSVFIKYIHSIMYILSLQS